MFLKEELALIKMLTVVFGSVGLATFAGNAVENIPVWVGWKTAQASEFVEDKIEELREAANEQEIRKQNTVTYEDDTETYESGPEVGVVY